MADDMSKADRSNPPIDDIDKFAETAGFPKRKFPLAAQLVASGQRDLIVAKLRKAHIQGHTKEALVAWLAKVHGIETAPDALEKYMRKAR